MEQEIEEYRVCYIDAEGDSCKVRVYADDEEHAKLVAKDEYWDIVEIQMVNKV